MLIVEHPFQYLWKNAKLRGPKKPTKGHLLDPFAVKARRAMAAFAAPPQQQAQAMGGSAGGSESGSQTGRTRQKNKNNKKNKKNKKNKRTATRAAADGEPPAYTRRMSGKCLCCGDPHMAAVYPVAKEEDDRTDADKAKVKAFKDEAKAVRAARKKWVDKQQ